MFISTKQLSKNFNYEEFFTSSIAKAEGISNYPTLANYDLVACNVLRLSYILQRIRDIIQLPVYISSGFRCNELNKVVGGVADSRHLYGAAVDIKCRDFNKLVVLCRKFEKELYIENTFRLANVLSNKRSYCIKVIKEPTWVHIQLQSPAACMNLEEFRELVNSVII